METRKAITIGVIAIIFIATIAVFAALIVGEKSSVSYPSPVQNSTSISDVPYDAGDIVQVDSDVASLEADLDSISDEDFGDANLSDSAVGL